MVDPYMAVVTALEPNPAGPGLLEGVAFAAKDLFDVAGVPTHAGNPDFAARWGLPKRDAWAVAALKAAGAQLVAKVHTHELAYGMSGINAHFGTPQNPRVAGGVPGGSSSGSAVAVAGGLVPLALGSDTGGSVRIPASFCGVYAYRPTHGVVSLEGVVPLAHSYDTAGLLAANPEVMRLGGRVLFGDALPSFGFERAVVLSDGLELCEVSAQQAASEVAQRLSKLGLRVEERRLGLLDEAREVQRVVQGAQAWGLHQPWVEQSQPRLGADVRKLLEMASRLSSAEVGRGISQQVKLRAEMGALFEPGTLVVLPSTPGPAPLICDLEDTDYALKLRWRTLSLTCFASVLEVPALGIPSRQEPPVGVQLVGPWGSDRALLDLACRL